MNILIATLKPWNIEKATAFLKTSDASGEVITREEDLIIDRVEKVNPDYLFFPHWSWKVPELIVETYECVFFHMTDLPFGRGGSPLQNLIVRGMDQTKVTAFRGTPHLDAGPVYLKEDLSLHGSAEEIFIRLADTIFDTMIPRILRENITPHPQKGDVVEFTRRTPADSEIREDFDLETLYNHIRMLDADGYPSAFLDLGSLRLTFTEARKKHKRIVARVEITEQK